MHMMPGFPMVPFLGLYRRDPWDCHRTAFKTARDGARGVCLNGRTLFQIVYALGLQPYPQVRWLDPPGIPTIELKTEVGQEPWGF